MYPVLKLKEGKEANVGFRHPWIFSRALADGQKKPEHGALVHVADRQGRIIGTGTYSASSSIAVRVFAFKEAVIDRAWLAAKIADAHQKRVLMGYGPRPPLEQSLPLEKGEKFTTGYRCVFGESDGIPGLVVDRYGDVLVCQIATAGLDALRDDVVAALEETFKPRAIVERSDMPSRREENLEAVVRIHTPATPPPAEKRPAGSLPLERGGRALGQVEFLEHGRRCVADPLHGQKTGFFLDQKDLRDRVAALAQGKTVLNLFSYTGATSFAAFAGGAKSVLNVDGSEEALASLRAQAAAAGLSDEVCATEKADVFQWLANPHHLPLAKGESEGVAGAFDVVVMDPPALIKSMKDAEEGKKAYHFLNRAALKLVKDGGIFITSSCSHFLPEEDLVFLLRRASVQAGVDLQVLEVVRQSPDHPLSVYFPEAAYLKSFVCRMNRL